MQIDRQLYAVGVKDRAIRLFEAQYPVPQGISYNSYVIKDDRIAVFDTVDAHFTDDWLLNLNAVLDGRTPDYLVITHMEPDHSAGIGAFAARYPEAVVVASHKAFAMMRAFYGDAFEERRRVVVDGDTLSLGTHELCFFSAPMVHWPEVTVAFDRTDGTLFSADAFGRFGAEENVPWVDEAARYYFGIVGKYGAQVQVLLQKLADLPIKRICPLHGPILTDEIPTVVSLYDTWSSYRPDKHAVMIAYTSVYGHTEEAIHTLQGMLSGEVVIHDLVHGDMTAAIADAFRCDALVLATTTYNMDVFPPMRTFLRHLHERNFRNRTVGLIENGAWAPMAATVMRRLLEPCSDIAIPCDTVTVNGRLDLLAVEKLRALASVINERI